MKIFTIIALIFCCLFLFTTAVSAVNIADVDCPCGACNSKAIMCLCGSAIKALHEAGFTDDDIQKYLNSQGTKV